MEEKCDAVGDSCCSGVSCSTKSADLVCDNTSKTCVACGSEGQPPCFLKECVDAKPPCKNPYYCNGEDGVVYNGRCYDSKFVGPCDDPGCNPDETGFLHPRCECSLLYTKPVWTGDPIGCMCLTDSAA